MTSLGARREAVRAEKGLGGASLVELYEELSWHRFRAEQGRSFVSAAWANSLESVILNRIAAQPIGAWEGENPRLRYGVSDAERSYRCRRCGVSAMVVSRILSRVLWPHVKEEC